MRAPCAGNAVSTRHLRCCKLKIVIVHCCTQVSELNRRGLWQHTRPDQADELLRLVSRAAASVAPPMPSPGPEAQTKVLVTKPTWVLLPSWPTVPSGLAKSPGAAAEDRSLFECILSPLLHPKQGLAVPHAKEMAQGLVSDPGSCLAQAIESQCMWYAPVSCSGLYTPLISSQLHARQLVAQMIKPQPA